MVGLILCAAALGAAEDPFGVIERGRFEGLMRELVACGTRVPGYEGNRRAEEIMLQALRASSVDEWGVHRFVVPSPVELDARISAHAGADRYECRIRCLWPNLVSPSTAEIVNAPLVYAGAGDLREFDGLDVEGSIVLMGFDSGRRWLNCPLLGAKAVVFIEPEDACRSEAEDKFLMTPLDFPRFWVSREDGLRLKGLARLKGAAATVRAKMEWRNVELRNVWGFIDGSDDDFKDQLVVVEAYFDSMSAVPALAPGAEAAASASALVECARYLASKRPKRPVLVLATNAHSLALAGMREFYGLLDCSLEKYDEKLAEARVRIWMTETLTKLVKNWERFEPASERRDLLDVTYPPVPGFLGWAVSFPGFIGTAVALFAVALAVVLAAVKGEQAGLESPDSPEPGRPRRWSAKGAASVAGLSCAVLSVLVLYVVFRIVTRQLVAHRPEVERTAEALNLAREHGLARTLGMMSDGPSAVTLATKEFKEFVDDRMAAHEDVLRYLRLGEEGLSQEEKRELDRLNALTSLLSRVKMKIRRARLYDKFEDEEKKIVDEEFERQRVGFLKELGRRKGALAARLSRLEANRELRDLLEPYKQAFFLCLDISSRTSKLGAFYKGHYLNQRGRTEQQFDELGRIAMRVGGGIEASAKMLPEAVLVDAIHMRKGRRWHSFLPGNFAFDIEIPTQAGHAKKTRVPSKGFCLASVDDSRPYVDTPHDTLSRLRAENLPLLVGFSTRFIEEMADEVGIAKPIKPDRFVGFPTIRGKVVRKGGSRSVFASKPVADALIVRRSRAKSYTGVRADAMMMTDHLGEFDHVSAKFYSGESLEAYVVSPETGEIVCAVDKGTMNIGANAAVGLSVRDVEHEVRIQVFPCKSMAVLDLIDQRFFSQLRNANVLDARTESKPLQYGTALPVVGEPVCIIFAQPDARLKVTFSEGVLGVRMALLNIVEGGPFKGSGFSVATTPLVPFCTYQAAMDMYTLDDRRIKQLLEHGITNRRLSWPEDSKELSGVGDAAEKLRIRGKGVVRFHSGEFCVYVEGRGELHELCGELAKLARRAEGPLDLLPTALPPSWTMVGEAREYPNVLERLAPGAGEFYEHLEWRGGGRAEYQTPEAEATVEVHAFRAPEKASEMYQVWKLSGGRGLHDTCGLLLRKAEAAKARREHSRFVNLTRNAWGIESRAYPDVRRTQDDTVMGVIFYLFLVLPFCYFLERLLFAFPKIQHQIGGFFLIFLTTFALLWKIHPAFQLTNSSMMVLLAFVILALAILVISIVYTRFTREIKGLQEQVEGVQSADVNRLSASSVAIMLGISNMRRRKLRTILTCTTIVILTFTVLSFTSIVHTLSKPEIDLDRDAPYEGMLLRDVGWKELDPAVHEILENEFGGEHTVAPRTWYVSQDPSWPTHVQITRGTRERKVNAIVGLSSREPDIFEVLRLPPAEARSALAAGEWFKEAERGKKRTILPEEVARALFGSAQRAVGGKVGMFGSEYEVCGVLRSDRFFSVLDLNGEELTPVDYKAEEQAGPPTEGVSEAIEALDKTLGKRYEHMYPDNLAILPWDETLSLGGTLRSVAVKFREGSESKALVSSFLERIEKNLYAGVEGKTYLYASTAALSLKGLGRLLVPIAIAGLIVFNTMIGAVYERNREIGIFSALGLAPLHIGLLFLAESCVYATIGAIAGYALGQVVAWLFSHVEVLTALLSGLELNYSSTSTIFVTLITMASVVLSTLYPATMAARIAVPSAERRWSVPSPRGDEIFLELPFTYPPEHAVGVNMFLKDFFSAHTESTVGRFHVLELHFEKVSTPRGEGFCQYFLCSLTPYDLGVSQEVQLYTVPTEEGNYIAEISLHRVSGYTTSWVRTNGPFLNSVRKQMLIWRTFSGEQRASFAERGKKVLLKEA